MADGVEMMPSVQPLLTFGQLFDYRSSFCACPLTFAKNCNLTQIIVIYCGKCALRDHFPSLRPLKIENSSPIQFLRGQADIGAK
jgi:hypothetical protein